MATRDMTRDELERLVDVDQLRAAAGELEAIGDTDSDERIVAGIGVPFGEVVDVGGFREMFDPACEFDELDRARLFYRHGEVIGVYVGGSRSDAGLRVELRVSRTQLGDEAYTLARDGALDRFSIGFRPVEWLVREDGVIVHTRVKVREFSLVPHPAYPGAVVDQIRTAPTTTTREDTMTDTLTRAELDTVLGDQRRELEASLQRALEQHNTGPAVIGEQWRSQGEYLKAIAAGDADALEFHRAFTGSVVADSATPSTWIADAIKLVETKRKVLNSFQRDSLPAEGMTLEFAKLLSNTITVAEQVTEGADLAFGEVRLTTGTAAVKTYGGYTQLSLQAVQRSATPFLNTALQAMDLAYAKATELAVRSFLASLITAQKTAGNKLDLADLSAATVFDWLDLVVDATETADDRGFEVAGLKVSKDVFKTLYRLNAGGEPLLKVSKGTDSVNRVGTLRASELSADLADVTVELVPGAAPLTASFYDTVAITTWEQPGAPMQLQDDNVVQLSRDFSKYGAVAIGSQYPTALVPVAIAAA